MPYKKAKQSHSKKFTIPANLKLLGLTAMLLGVGWYTWSQYSTYTKGLPPERSETPGLAASGSNDSRGNRGDRRGGSFRDLSPEERRQQFQERFQERMQEFNVTPEQQKKIEEIWNQPTPQSPEAWRERREAMRNVFTPEQREQMRQSFAQGRRGGMGGRGGGRFQRGMSRFDDVLSPEDRNELQRRLENRMENRGNRGRAGAPGSSGASSGR